VTAATANLVPMEPERIFLAAFLAFVYVVLTGVLIGVDWAAASGRLRRNQWAGIRTPSTMRSDRAWVAGHRAALRLTPLHLLTLAALLIVLVVAVRRVQTVAGINIIGIGGAMVFVVVALITALVAGRAANAAEDQSDD
jgi:hypothetical protein